jgi:hypothetical protein
MGWRQFKAFADPADGEAGAIYRALGWRPLAPTHGKRWCHALIDAGRVMSDRAIYRRHGSHEAARASGALIVRRLARVGWVAA